MSQHTSTANPFDELDAWERHAVLRAGTHAHYVLYLRSRPWRRFRRLMLEAACGMCEHCGVSEDDSMLLLLEVHHRHYRTLGAELPKDVLVLCHACHIEADRVRRGA